jgi:glyoxylase I family protein
LVFQGVEHVAIASPDPKRLAEWYAAHLDFRINYEHEGTHFVRAGNGAVLEIISSVGEPSATEFRTPGLRHIAIAVDSFDTAYAQLRSQGVQFRGEPYEHQGNRLVFFADPDGNLLHLIQRAQPLP